MKNRKELSRKRGVSLIEGVLYLVISLSILVGGISFFKQAQRANDRTELARGLISISTGVRELYSNAKGVDEDVDLTLALAKSGWVPESFLNVNSVTNQLEIINPSSEASAPGLNKIFVYGMMEMFEVTLWDVTLDTCLYFMNLDADGSGPAGINLAGMDFRVTDTSETPAPWGWQTYSLYPGYVPGSDPDVCNPSYYGNSYPSDPVWVLHFYYMKNEDTNQYNSI